MYIIASWWQVERKARIVEISKVSMVKNVVEPVFIVESRHILDLKHSVDSYLII